MFTKKKWTELNKPPKEVFDDACIFLAESLEGKGFSYLRSTNTLIKDDNIEDLQFMVDFGTTARNQKNVQVNFNVHLVIRSSRLKAWRKKMFLAKNWGEPDDLITNIGLGHLMANNDYASGSWNLIESNPKIILDAIERYALPAFQKFNRVDELIQDLRNGETIPFCFDFQKLDFLMCFGGQEFAAECLNTILSERNWHEVFHNKLDLLRNGQDIDKSQGLISQLVHRADFYDIKLSKTEQQKH